MALITWNEFRVSESSPATRAKRDVANGLKPLAAMSSPFSHSTDNPDIEEKIIKKLKKDKKSKHKNEAVRKPNYEFDKFLSKADKTKEELKADKAKAEEDEKEIDTRLSAATQKKKELEDKKLNANKQKSVVKKPDDKKKKPTDKDTHLEWEVLCGEMICDA